MTYINSFLLSLKCFTKLLMGFSMHVFKIKNVEQNKKRQKTLKKWQE